MKEQEFKKRLTEIKHTFNIAQEKIGATEVLFKLVPRELQDTIVQFNEGKAITGVELQKIAGHWKSREPFIDEEGNPFVLFISDFSSSQMYGNLPKYHVAWCRTLENMQAIGRMKRYIKKSDIETNVFVGKNNAGYNTQG